MPNLERKITQFKKNLPYTKIFVKILTGRAADQFRTKIIGKMLQLVILANQPISIMQQVC